MSCLFMNRLMEPRVSDCVIYCGAEASNLKEIQFQLRWEGEDAHGAHCVCLLVLHVTNYANIGAVRNKIKTPNLTAPPDFFLETSLCFQILAIKFLNAMPLLPMYMMAKTTLQSCISKYIPNMIQKNTQCVIGGTIALEQQSTDFLCVEFVLFLSYSQVL